MTVEERLEAISRGVLMPDDLEWAVRVIKVQRDALKEVVESVDGWSITTFCECGKGAASACEGCKIAVEIAKKSLGMGGVR